MGKTLEIVCRDELTMRCDICNESFPKGIRLCSYLMSGFPEYNICYLCNFKHNKDIHRIIDKSEITDCKKFTDIKYLDGST